MIRDLSKMYPQARHPVPHHPGQPFKFTVPESCDRIKEEFQFLQAQFHRFRGSEVLRFRGSEVLMFRGSEVLRFRGSETLTLTPVLPVTPVLTLI
ncbi:unnamed protein product [Coregonus sp. 'balchen']|nr:unnamed protein product [Coregonus sp. 'balchen']